MGKNSNFRGSKKGSNPNPPRGKGGRGQGRGKVPHRGGNFQPIGGKSGQEVRGRRDRTPSRSPSRHARQSDEKGSDSRRSDSRRSDSRSSHHSDRSGSRNSRSGRHQNKVWVNPSLTEATIESTVRGETTGASSEKPDTKSAKKIATSATNKTVETTEESTAKAETTGASIKFFTGWCKKLPRG